MDFGRYFVPGPSEVHPDVLQAMARPVVYHRTPEARELLDRVQPVTLVNGAFSERFARIAAACGHDVERCEKPWGAVHAPADLAIDGHQAVTVVHSETSTGALQPLAELARAADVPLLVDSVSGAGGVPVEMDARGLAYVCTGAQKALALPPGLGFAAASERLLELAAGADRRGLYLDLLEYEAKAPPFTPAISLLYALDAQLQRIAREGLAARFARHQRMAERTWAWVASARERLGVGLEVLAPEGFRSPTVTCIRLPAPLTGPEVVRRLRERGYSVAAGYGRLKETSFRIGHMGEQTTETLEGLLAACDEALVG
ncbi:MAG: pyridoxal-phosphate-dependent aminotransferase family protein [Planctomycetota bacterium]|jgi:aspartate aminotransferase-like enzyme